MNIALRCKCGKEFSVSEDTDTQTVPCPACSEQVIVPSIASLLGDLVGNEDWLRLTCPCGKVIKAPRKWAGRKGFCPSCKAPIVMPDAPLSPDDDSQVSDGVEVDPVSAPPSFMVPPPRPPVEPKSEPVAAADPDPVASSPAAAPEVNAPTQALAAPADSPAPTELQTQANAPAEPAPPAEPAFPIGRAMDIDLRCKCGKSFSVSEDIDTQTVPCPACGKEVIVPSIASLLGDLVGNEEWLRLTCDCGKVIKAPKKWAGRNGFCPSCKKPIVMPDAPLSPGDDSQVSGGVEMDQVQAPPTFMVPPDAPQAARTESPAAVAPALATANVVSDAHAAPSAPAPSAPQPQTQPNADAATKPGWAASAWAWRVVHSVITPDPLPVEDPRGYHKAPSLAAQIRIGLNRRRRLVAALCVLMILGIGTKAAIDFGHTGKIIPAVISENIRELFHRTGPASMSLLEATKEGNVDQVRANLKEGRDINAADHHGMTPLSAACIRGEVDAVAALIDAGADPKETNPQGRTPLHWAASSGRTAVVKLLLERGAAMNAVTAEGKTAFEEATLFGHTETAELLAATKAPAPTSATQPDAAPESTYAANSNPPPSTAP